MAKKKKEPPLADWKGWMKKFFFIWIAAIVCFALLKDMVQNPPQKDIDLSNVSGSAIMQGAKDIVNDLIELGRTPTHLEVRPMGDGRAVPDNRVRGYTYQRYQ